MKRLKNRGVFPRTHIKDLVIDDRTYSTPGEEASALTQAFFPPPRLADLDDINEDDEYPEPLPCLKITLAEVGAAIRHARAGRAQARTNWPTTYSV